MAEYTILFGVALLLDIIITFRASRLWTRYSHYFPFCCSYPVTHNVPIEVVPEGEENENDDEKQSLVMEEGEAKTDKNNDEQSNARYSLLLRNYLIVYLLATFSDWLQGAYVYALYDAYDYPQHLIAVLFVAGFGSSMVFGSFVGGMADRGGRRRFVVIFSMIYAASCLTKHFRNFHVLMLGRLLGGIATSLLFSVFEAWLIRAHANAKVMDKLSSSFSTAGFGNSVIAILAGLVSNKAASHGKLRPWDASLDTKEGMFFVDGYLNPFDIALLALICCGICATFLWEENYGESGGKENAENSPKWYDGLKRAYKTTIRNRDILLCGLVSSLFEGSMYIFVFMWTPAMQNLAKKEEGLGEDESVELPYGLIFSTFMVCCMTGSSLFSIVAERMKGEALAVVVFAVSSVAMSLVIVSSNSNVTFIAMNIFEICVGMYFPVMGTMKGMIVPEDQRAAIYNLYRIPLNFIVVSSLLAHLTATQGFVAVTIMLITATFLQLALARRRLNVSSLADMSHLQSLAMNTAKIKL
uniref:Molybdate-anion transporter n=1 Tax=Ditylum brightwellii TaxID=49249 RepID=A0A7S4RL49_9STRA|mmetsp:Transcript_25844/g.34297  ORF Transcript_25844/g.34297 Transcript_25844/m.34297 type:complete len:526 (+) Transcript_25844:66-1643(+)